MGMDLYAEDYQPSDGWPQATDSFRANVWAWRPIAAAIEQALRESELTNLSDAERIALSYNDGKLIDQTRSVEFAEAIDKWLERHVAPHGDRHLGKRFVTLHTPDSVNGLLVDTVTAKPTLEVSLRWEDPRGPFESKAIGDSVIKVRPLSSTENGSAWTTTVEHLVAFSVFSRQSGGFRVF